MLRILKILLFLGVVGFAGLSGYAYLGDMAPERAEVRIPVELNVQK
ncbi:MAG: hypothetical protein KDE00_04090 [Rhodobacteraceae bacterium]|nr:hypothetical protein [Paracoccaceae bacterium]